MTRRTALTRAHRRRSRSGIALLLVVASIMVLTTLVTDLQFGARVRILAAAHERDAISAQYLARSGVSIYRLILTANKQLAKNQMLTAYAAQLGVSPGDMLWKMIPFINTGLLRMLLVSDGDVSEEDARSFAQSGQVSEDVAAQSREEGGGHFAGRNFLDFPGDFTTEVRGEDCRINVNAFSTVTTDTLAQDTPIGQQLAGLMSGEDNDQWLHERNLDKWDLINNLRDWVDADNVVASGKGGYEDDFYNRRADPYLAKNARFDTLLEIRMVEGWQDDVYERFGGQLTVYGSGKVDLNCVDDNTLRGLFRAYVSSNLTDSALDKLVSDYHTAQETQGNLTSGTALVSWLKTEGYAVNSALSSAVTTSATVFTLTSTGQVGDASSRLTAVIDYSSTTEGKILYWRAD